MSESGPETSASTTDDGLPNFEDDAVAGSFATALLSMREWVHRRVEALVFTDAETVRRTTSVDFTVPSYLPQIALASGSLTLVPLAYLAKRPVSSLDVRDAAGGAVPVLTTEQNGALTAAALTSLAVALVQDRARTDRLSISDIGDLLRGVALSPTVGARARFEAMQTVLNEHIVRGGPLAALARTAEFIEIVGTLVDNFVLVAVISASAGQRCILKFSYVEPAQGETDERGVSEKVLDGLGFTPTTLVLEVPAANLASSFHVEVTAPDGVGITEAVLYGAARGEVVSAPSVREGRRTVHLLAPREPGPACQVKVNLRASPGGWLRSTFAAVTVVAFLLTLCAIRLDAVVEAPAGQTPRPAGDVAALLLAFVGVVVALVVRPGEHALTARLLTWARAVTMVAVALPFVGAWLLAFGPRGTALTVVWWLLAGVGWAIALLMFRVYRGPALVISHS